MPAEFTIEVAYALPHKQSLLSVSVVEGATVEQSIQNSGILELYPELVLNQQLKVGIWSRACKLDSLVKEGDRIEIYRPLIADPKLVRKQRAERAKLEGRADKVTGGRVNPKRAASGLSSE